MNTARHTGDAQMNPYYITRNDKEIGVEAATRAGIMLAAETLLGEGEAAPLELRGPNGYKALATLTDRGTLHLRGTWGA